MINGRKLMTASAALAVMSQAKAITGNRRILLTSGHAISAPGDSIEPLHSGGGFAPYVLPIIDQPQIAVLVGNL